MSAQTRHIDDHIKDLAHLSILHATATSVIHDGKRDAKQRQALLRALQLFKENRLAGAIARPTDGQLPERLHEILSQKLADVLPRFAADTLAGHGVEYVGELLLLHPQIWKRKSGTKSFQVCRQLLADYGIPIDLDLDKSGWIPSYARDEKVLQLWNMRVHDLLPDRACPWKDGCFSVGELIRRTSRFTEFAARGGSLRLHVEALGNWKLHLRMFVPATWQPPVRNLDACRTHAKAQWDGYPISPSLKRQLDEFGFDSTESLTRETQWGLTQKFGGPGHHDVLFLVERVKRANLEFRKPSADNPSADELIETAEFSFRTANCLKHAGISSFGELAERTENELLGIANFGWKSFNEVRDELAKRGLSVKGEPST